MLAGVVVTALLARPSSSQSFLRLDLAIVAAIAVTAFQLVPLRPGVRNALSPSAAPVEAQLRFVDRGANRPLTLDAEAGAAALIVMAGVALLFWSARTMFGDGGMRQTCRWIARFGLLAAAVAVTQHATAPRLLYWVWPPASASARPFSPFVNRNDLAAWVVMAIPLTVGYLMTRIESKRQGPAFDLDAIDATTVWLGGAVAAMAIALLATLSRSGITAAAASAVVFLLVSRQRIARRGQITLLGGVAVVALVALVYVNTGDLIARVDETLAAGVGGRREIWAATRLMIRDFPLVGIGVGAYGRAMSVYQPPHLFAFNHAHSEYLQIVAEGGIALGALALGIVVLSAIAIARQLRSDATPMWWTRAGATSALAAIAVQSVWETGSRMPANAVLLAICAAIAMQEKR